MDTSSWDILYRLCCYFSVYTAYSNYHAVSLQCTVNETFSSVICVQIKRLCNHHCTSVRACSCNAQKLSFASYTNFDWYYFHRHRRLVQGTVVVQALSAGVLVSARSLVLQSVSRTRAGDYTCTAGNVHGETQSLPLMLNVRCKQATTSAGSGICKQTTAVLGSVFCK